MDSFSSQFFLILFLIISIQFGTIIKAQKSKSTQKGAPELMDIGYAPFNVGAYSGTENDVLNKIETQLFGALELLQAYQEAAPLPIKFAEKRRNKFEFIRFGRRRR